MKNLYKLLVLAIIGLACLFTGTFLFDLKQGSEFIRNYGYWYILIVFTTFLICGYKVIRKTYDRNSFSKSLLALKKPKYLGALLGLSILFVFSQVHEAKEFKIVMDEPNLAGVAMSMHMNQEAFVPARAHTLLGNYTLLGGYVDKRPLFFPFLISIVHDIKGYDINNIFILNTLLSATFILLIYWLCYQYRGVSSGLIGALLVVSLPLWVQNANGGGFELLNCVMIASSMAISIGFLKNLNKNWLNLLILHSVLLTQVRYESLLYLIPVAIVILLGWLKRGKIFSSWALYIWPVLMIPYLLQHKVFQSANDFWQLADKPEANAPFSINYISENLGHAFNFFFNTSESMPNSILLSIVGFIALIFLLIHLFKVANKGRYFKTMDRILGIYLLGFLANGLLLLLYFYGQIDNPIIQRLSLPLHIPLILATVWLVYKKNKSKSIIRGFTGIVLAYTMGISIPTISASTYSKTYIPAHEVSWLMHYAQEVTDSNKRVLVISERAVLWILNKVDAVSLGAAATTPEKVHMYQSFEAAPEVWTHQVLTKKLNSDDYSTEMQLPSTWETEPVLYRNISLVRKIVISKITPNNNKIDLPKKPNFTSYDDYLNYWAKNLP